MPRLRRVGSAVLSFGERAAGMPAVTHRTRTESPMTLELINPDDLPTPPHVHPRHRRDRKQDRVQLPAKNPRTLTGNLVSPGDLAAQASQVFANLGRAPAACDTRPRQVAKITIYVVHHRPEYLPAIEEARQALFGDHKPADTVIGVDTLARPQYLIEVNAIAVIRPGREPLPEPE